MEYKLRQWNLSLLIDRILVCSSYIVVCVEGCVCDQSCLTLCNPMDCNLPGSSVHGIFQTRILEEVAISFSRGSSQPRDWTQVSCLSCMAGGFFSHCITWEPLLCGRSLYLIWIYQQSAHFLIDKSEGYFWTFAFTNSAAMNILDLCYPVYICNNFSATAVLNVDPWSLRVPEILSWDPCVIMFTEPSFFFFKVLTFSMNLQKQWWVKLTAS